MDYTNEKNSNNCKEFCSNYTSLNDKVVGWCYNRGEIFAIENEFTAEQ